MLPLLLLAAPPPSFPDWAAFAADRRNDCVGKAASLESPLEITAGPHKYRIEGHRLVQLDKDPDGALKVGVISALKDSRDETLAQLRDFAGKLKDVDVLVVNGDVASNLFEMQKVAAALGELPLLVLVVIGNTESCGWFNQATAEAAESHKNLVNGNWVRRLDLDDATLLTLPGYYDKRFTHTGGAARYKPEEMERMRDMLEGAQAPVVLVSHGPPKGAFDKAIDVADGAGNVGDPDITDMMLAAKIPFGIFGHILEAGGRATDVEGKVVRAAGKWHPSLIVNAGTANPDPWSMLDKSTSYGMALRVEIEKDRAKYAVINAPKPK